MGTADYFKEYCKHANKYKSGLNVKEGQWLEEMEDMIEAAVRNSSTIQSYFSEYCQERNRYFAGFGIGDSQWLEEMSFQTFEFNGSEKAVNLS